MDKDNQNRGGYTMKRYYVAYGSNLNLSQMALRCPTAKVYSSGVLNNWELIFRGSKTGSYATIRRKKGSVVPVVIWEIQPKDEKNLDVYEGYPRFYFKQNVMVDLPEGKKKAMVYIMDTMRLPGIPSRQYVETVEQGYLDNNLDLEYLQDALVRNRIECTKKGAPFTGTFWGI